MRAGLKKVVKTVRGKRGTVRRSYYVKANEAPKKQGFLSRHKGKIAAGALALGAAALASRHRLALRGAYHGARAAHADNKAIHGNMQRFGKGMSLMTRAKHVLGGARRGAQVGNELRPQIRGGWRRLRTSGQAVAAGRYVNSYLAASNALSGYRD